MASERWEAAMKKFFFLILSAFIATAGCGSGSSSGTGLLSVAVADAPVDDADAVVVEFTGVEVKPASGDRLDFVFTTPKQIDLLALTGGESEIILDGEVLPSGNYNWIRLAVNADQDVIDSYIDIDAVRYSIWVPSGDETGLKLNRGFVVPVNDSVDFTIDFDLRKSVHEPEGLDGNYILRPTLRIVDNTEVGAIRGTVAEALITDSACTDGNAVYVYEGHDVTPDDVDGIEPEPVTTALVTFDDDSGEYEYKAAFLIAGDYTVAFTCQSADDDPATDDSIDFTGAANVTVTTDSDTEHDFS